MASGPVLGQQKGRCDPIRSSLCLYVVVNSSLVAVVAVVVTVLISLAVVAAIEFAVAEF